MAMTQEHDKNGSNYGSIFGFIYVFNLIVGTGALTMPKAFETAGYLLSTGLIIFLTVMSYVTGTFVIEAMSIANSIKTASKDTELNIETYNSLITKSASRTSIPKSESINNDCKHDDLNDDVIAIQTNYVEERPLVLYENQYSDEEYASKNNLLNNNFNKLFEIKSKFEMGEMAAMFFNKFGLYCFYLSIILYLYGDLAIYNAAVSKSLRDTTCTFYPKTNNTNQTVILNETDPCWSSNSRFLTRMNVYRLYVIIFNLLIGSLVFYNVQKTKFLQLCTTLMRWFAFITMIILAIRRIINNKTDEINVKPFNIKGVPNFFGVCIYAFMCHHSLPSIITPIKNKIRFKYVFFIDYLSILCFYLVLSYTGTFAFGENLNDFYTLNFEPSHHSDSKNTNSTLLIIIDYYLSLFPVFTLSASFPIIGITLRNNLISIYNLFLNGSANYKRNRMSNIMNNSKFTFFTFPLITLIPPLIISLITHDLQLLVGITGSYAGVTIQYIFPALLVYFGRRESIRTFRFNYQDINDNHSPFKSKYWVFFILVWANFSVIFVTVNHIITRA